jgi:cell division protein ZapA (FtsZ GTPase activity inhibitor)
MLALAEKLDKKLKVRIYLHFSFQTILVLFKIKKKTRQLECLKVHILLAIRMPLFH